MSEFERLVYEIENTWDEEFFGTETAERFEITAANIPDDVQSMLDMGCGSGLFLAYLKRRRPDRFARLAGADRSLSALERVNAERIACSIDDSPFADCEFDLVSSLQVLEHLPNTVLRDAIVEIARIAKRYILITVPYREDLAASFVTCDECRTRFSPDYHLHSFDENRLSGLFDGRGFSCRNTFLIGSVQRYIGYDFIKTRILGNVPVFPWWTLCPACGFGVDKPAGSSSRISKNPQYSGLGKTIRGLWPKQTLRLRIGALYIRS